MKEFDFVDARKFGMSYVAVGDMVDVTLRSKYERSNYCTVRDELSDTTIMARIVDFDGSKVRLDISTAYHANCITLSSTDIKFITVHTAGTDTNAAGEAL